VRVGRRGVREWGISERGEAMRMRGKE